MGALQSWRIKYHDIRALRLELLTSAPGLVKIFVFVETRRKNVWKHMSADIGYRARRAPCVNLCAGVTVPGVSAQTAA